MPNDLMNREGKAKDRHSIEEKSYPTVVVVSGETSRVLPRQVLGQQFQVWQLEKVDISLHFQTLPMMASQ